MYQVLFVIAIISLCMYSIYSILFHFYKENADNNEIHEQKMHSITQSIAKINDEIFDINVVINDLKQQSQKIEKKFFINYSDNIKIVKNIFKILNKHETLMNNYRNTDDENKIIWH